MHAPPRLTPGALAAALALLAGCAVKPGFAVCSSHAECPSGSTCQEGVCQEGLALEFAAPAAAHAYAATALPIQLGVAGFVPPSVQLVVDERAAVAFGPPFAGTLDTSALAEGAHTLYAIAEVGGRTYRSPTRTVDVDRTAPAVPAVAAAATSAADPVTVTGTLAADGGTPVTVTLYEGATVKASGIVARDGAWSASVSLAEGAHALTARAADAAGNASALSAAAAVVVDRTAPPVPTLASKTTREPNPVTVSGTLPADAPDAGTPITLAVYEGATLLASGLAPGGGAWSAALELTEGTHLLSVRATDAAGNASTPSTAATVVVDRTAPPTPSVTAQVTNAQDPVTVSGLVPPDGGTAVTVTLYEGAATLASGLVPSGGAWSAAVPLSVGSHALTARAFDAAGNVSELSPAANVGVDRTAPAITAHVPADLATNVWTRDPITVTFSEPVLPASVTAATVVLARSDGTAILNTPSLSADRRTLTVTPNLLPAVPDTFTMRLSGITDDAGNRLPDARWSWYAPEWQDLGAPIVLSQRVGVRMLALALDPAGLPVVAAHWSGGPYTNGFEMSRCTGSLAWEPVPQPSLTGNAVSGGLAAGARDVFATFGTDTGDVWAGRYGGSAWSDAAQLDVDLASSATTPSLALDGAGAPYVAWLETASGVDRVFARRWSGSAWARLGDGAVSAATGAARAPATTTGTVRVSWLVDATYTEGWTDAWSGSAWETARSAGSGYGLNGDLVADSTGTLYVPTSNQIYRWVAGALGSAYLDDLKLAASFSSPVAIALAPSGYPVIGWYRTDAPPSGFEVMRYDAAAKWVTLTTARLPSESRIHRLAVSPGGVVAVARTVTVATTGPPHDEVHVSRYNR